MLMVSIGMLKLKMGLYIDLETLMTEQFIGMEIVSKEEVYKFQKKYKKDLINRMVIDQHLTQFVVNLKFNTIL